MPSPGHFLPALRGAVVGLRVRSYRYVAVARGDLLMVIFAIAGAQSLAHTWAGRAVQKVRLSEAVSLARYAAIVGYRETAFWGINHPDNALYACREVWSEAERQMVREALDQAQDMLEQECAIRFRRRT
jgi:hypothetical protein